jgi:hypothetical protein
VRIDRHHNHTVMSDSGVKDRKGTLLGPHYQDKAWRVKGWPNDRKSYPKDRMYHNRIFGYLTYLI